MTQATKHADVEKQYSRSESIDKLRRLADALENEEYFQIQIDHHRVNVPPRADIEFEYEAEGMDEEIEIEIKWTREQ